MKIFVTGGAGFIGSHLCLRLLKEGHSVVAYDNLWLGKEIFLEKCKTFPQFKFVKEDLMHMAALRGAMSGADQVWHLAANSDIEAGAKSTDLDLRIGTIATYNTLEAARLEGVREVIFSSTSAVYGETEVRPTPETFGPLMPISFYGASKLACEALVTAFSHNFDMKVWIYRFANIVGSHTTHGAIHDFVKRLKKDSSKLVVLGDGKQQKSYLHVDDCIDGMLFGFNNSKKQMNLFNLASQGFCRVSDIAATVIGEMKMSAQIEYTGGSRGWKGDVAITELDGRVLQSMGWKPKHDSEKAMSQAVKDIIASEFFRFI